MELMSDLNVTVSEIAEPVSVTILHLAGRINLSNTQTLERMAGEALDHGAQAMILDLTEVPSITSAGLRAIQAIYKRVEGGPPAGGSSEDRRSTHLKLVTPSSQVLRVLHTAGFDQYLHIFATVPDALRSYDVG